MLIAIIQLLYNICSLTIWGTYIFIVYLIMYIFEYLSLSVMFLICFMNIDCSGAHLPGAPRGTLITSHNILPERIASIHLLVACLTWTNFVLNS